MATTNTRLPADTPLAAAPLGLDMKNVNVAADTPELQANLQEIKDSQTRYLAALEDRYAQPNLYKVGAAFLKPQLGGFFASLGNAGEVLGENVEQRRAQELPIAQMRAQIAQTGLLMGQKKEADKIGQEWSATRDPAKLPETLAKMERFSPGSGVAFKALLDAQSSQAATTGQTVNTSLAGQKAVSDNPAIILTDPLFKGTGAEPKPDQIANYVANLNAARPKDIDKSQWDAMGTTEKQNQVARYANEQAAVGLNQEQKSAVGAETSTNLLNELAYLRTLAVDEKLAPLFSIMKNGDALSMYRSYLDKNPGNAQAAVEGLIAATADSLKNATPETRAKADKLIKGIARLEVNLRGSNVNPTDALTALSSASSPSLANSQAGFVGIIDQMGLQAKHVIDRHNFRVDSNVPARKVWSDPAMENAFREELIQQASANPLSPEGTPSWFKPKKQPTTLPQSVSRPSSSSPAAPTTLSAIQAELARQRQTAP